MYQFNICFDPTAERIEKEASDFIYIYISTCHDNLVTACAWPAASEVGHKDQNTSHFFAKASARAALAPAQVSKTEPL